MKNLFSTLFLAAGLSFGSLAANAQTLATADVPFSFTVQHLTLPPGHYRISKVSADNTVFAFEGDKGSAAMLNAASRSEKSLSEGKLTFACYGKSCVLASIAYPGSSVAYSVSKSAMEKDLPHSIGMSSMISVRLKTH